MNVFKEKNYQINCKHLYKRRFVIGDIHGQYEQLIDLLKLVDFDFENDLLISLGDIVDRGPDCYSCVELLKTIKHFISIKGNHDDAWFKSVLNNDIQNGLLYTQGGKETYKSYLEKNIDPKVHIDFFNNQVNYFIINDDEQIFYFVHAGLNRHELITNTDEDVLLWDRDFFTLAYTYHHFKNKDAQIKNRKFLIKGNPTKVFIGHTSTTFFDNTDQPIIVDVVRNIDTGSVFGGKLTIMNIDTDEYFQV